MVRAESLAAIVKSFFRPAGSLLHLPPLYSYNLNGWGNSLEIDPVKFTRNANGKCGGSGLPVGR